MPKHITVLLPNEPGTLHEVVETLAAADVNIWAHHLANLGRTGFVQLICIPHDKAFAVLRAKYNFYVTETEVLAVKVENTPGALQKVLSTLHSHKLNITNSYDTFDASGNAVTLLEMDIQPELTAAKKVLLAEGFELVDQLT